MITQESVSFSLYIWTCPKKCFRVCMCCLFVLQTDGSNFSLTTCEPWASCYLSVAALHNYPKTQWFNAAIIILLFLMVSVVGSFGKAWLARCLSCGCDQTVLGTGTAGNGAAGARWVSLRPSSRSLGTSLHGHCMWVSLSFLTAWWPHDSQTASTAAQSCRIGVSVNITKCISFLTQPWKSLCLISAAFYRLQEIQKTAQIQVEGNTPCLSMVGGPKSHCRITCGLGDIAVVAIFGTRHLPHALSKAELQKKDDNNTYLTGL